MKQAWKALLCAATAFLLAASPASPAFATTEPSVTATEAGQTTEHKHSYGGWEVVRKASNRKNGLLLRTCSSCGEKQTKRIARICSAKVKNIDKIYTGKAITNSITVKNKDGETLKRGRDYTVQYKNNKKVGVADMIITGIGKYECTFTRSFRIIPKRTQFTSILPSAKKAALKWTPVAAQADGYLIQYGTDKSFRKNTKVQKVKNAATASLTLTGLKQKTTYFVRIRTYRTVNDRTFYSLWPKTMTFKTPSATPYAIDGQVPKSARVDSSYFDDVVFVGDSISEGLNYYEAANDVLGKAKFLTSVSLSATNALWEISDRSVHPRWNGRKMKIEDAIPLTGAKKVYIMLGMNDIISVGVDKSVQNFTTLCNKILAKSPNVQIYVESVTPRTNQGAKSDNGPLNNKSITAYNKKLSALCQARGWYFVNVAEVMFDSTGYLNRSYCSDPNGMGMHFAYAGCKVWVDYLYTHTA